MRYRWRSNRFSFMWGLFLLFSLAGVLFWLMTGWLDQQILSETRASTTRLQAVGAHQVQLSLRLTIVSIDAIVDRSTQVSEVSIRTMGSPLEEMEFKFPVIEFAAVENAIAREIGLPAADIHDLIRYRVSS